MLIVKIIKIHLVKREIYLVNGEKEVTIVKAGKFEIDSIKTKDDYVFINGRFVNIDMICSITVTFSTGRSYSIKLPGYGHNLN